MKTIRETMPNLLIDGGIFKNLPLYGDMTAVQMGIAYCLKRSGNKGITTFVQYYLGNDGKVSSNNEQAIALILSNIYKDNWDARWSVLHQSYNPIQNTDKDITTTITHSGTDTFENGAQHSENKTGVRHNENENLRSADDDPTNYSKENKSVFDSNEATDEYDRDLFNNKTIHGHVETTHEVGGGNIGTMTSQYLVNEELRLRTYEFYESIFKDIDEYLALPIFGNSSIVSSADLFRLDDVQLQQTSGGALLTIGNQQALIRNGEDGQDGRNGTNGRNGVDGSDGRNGLTPELTLDDNGDLYVEYKETE